MKGGRKKAEEMPPNTNNKRTKATPHAISDFCVFLPEEQKNNRRFPAKRACIIGDTRKKERKEGGNRVMSRLIFFCSFQNGRRRKRQRTDFFPRQSQLLLFSSKFQEHARFPANNKRKRVTFIFFAFLFLLLWPTPKNKHRTPLLLTLDSFFFSPFLSSPPPKLYWPRPTETLFSQMT